MRVATGSPVAAWHGNGREEDIFSKFCHGISLMNLMGKIVGGGGGEMWYGKDQISSTFAIKSFMNTNSSIK